MIQHASKNDGPLVSVVLATYNRPDYVAQAIQSVLDQTCPDWELILVRDGGCRIDGVIELFDDDRILFIDRDENHGIAYSFNEGLSHARGKYVCYLGDDDLFYSNHIDVLLNALEGQEEFGAAYTDLYKVHCRMEEDGSRTVLAKNVEISRDFDRLHMLQFSHVLQVSVMHRRDLLEKTGSFNEQLNVLVDWDLLRRMVFYTDFRHVPEITGEYYAPVAGSDRVSDRRRENRDSFSRNFFTIRTARPPKPWLKMQDLSIVINTRQWDPQTARLLHEIYTHTFFPYQVYLPMPESELAKIQTEARHVLGVPIQPDTPPQKAIDLAIQCCDGDYIAIVEPEFLIEPNDMMWIERSLVPMIYTEDPTLALELYGSGPGHQAAVFGRDQIRRARRMFPDQEFWSSIIDSGINLRPPEVDEYPFQFDKILSVVEDLEQQAQWQTAAGVFEKMAAAGINELWMKMRQANALYQAGRVEQAVRVAAQVNDTRPSVAGLMLEARARKELNEYDKAIDLYEKAEEIIEGEETA